MIKTRTIDLLMQNFQSGKPDGEPYNHGPHVYEYIETQNNGKKRPWSPCYHWKVKVAPAYYYYSSTYAVGYNMGFPDINRCRQFFRNEVLSDINTPQFQFQKNNNFKAIQLIAELDDTLMLFTTKLVKALLKPQEGHLAIQFGILQIYEDFKSLLDTYYDLRSNIAVELAFAKPIKAEHSVPHSFSEYSEYNPAILKYSCEGKTILHGSLRITQPLPKGPTPAIILDELGLNDIVGNMWALVPFSFILDFFTGSFVPKLISWIRGAHPSNWFNPGWEFQGWVIHEAKGKQACMTSLEYLPSYSEFEMFDRYYTAFRPETKFPEIKWKLPTLEFGLILSCISLGFVKSGGKSMSDIVPGMIDGPKKPVFDFPDDIQDLIDKLYP